MTTIVSIDGVGAYDSISRKAMLEALVSMPGGSAVLPFVRLFHGQPSRYLWEDEDGAIHHIHQGEGGEQGDPLMPLLFSLGQHAALQAVRRRLQVGERLFAFLDDIYVTTVPERVGIVHNVLEQELYRHSRIHIHVGETQVWNAAGVRPPACDQLERLAQASDPEARVWKGSDIPTAEQGVRILGTPVGHPDFVSTFLQKVLNEHAVLLSRIPLLEDLQSAWALLLHCAGGRANYMLRVVRPEAVLRFAEGHTNGLWACLRNILGSSVDLDPTTRDICSLPLSLGGIGLRNAERTSPPAYWASWADCLAMLRARHPDVAALCVRQMQNPRGPPSLVAAQMAAGQLSGVAGFQVPSWDDLAHGLRPPELEPDDFEPGGCRGGWQHEGSIRVERQHRASVMVRLTDSERAMLRSQSGPLAGVPFSTPPANFLSRIDSHLFRVLLLRRLRLPFPLSARQCRCGRLLDALGHHRAACARAGVLGRRGFAVESAGARICREAGGRVVANALLRDFDLVAPNPRDQRRLEILADGLPLFGGAQLAVDTTLVSPLHCDGSPHPGAANVDGAVLVAARRRKERTYPELSGPRSRARLVVLAGEIGGRWSEETRRFLSLLAKAKARSEPPILKKRAEQAWRLRWGAILGCAAARAFAASLLELRSGGGADGDVPSTHEVVNDHRHAGLE